MFQNRSGSHNKIAFHHGFPWSFYSDDLETELLRHLLNIGIDNLRNNVIRPYLLEREKGS